MFCRPVVHRACDYSGRHLLCESQVPLVQECEFLLRRRSSSRHLRKRRFQIGCPRVAAIYGRFIFECVLRLGNFLLSQARLHRLTLHCHLGYPSPSVAADISFGRDQFTPTVECVVGVYFCFRVISQYDHDLKITRGRFVVRMTHNKKTKQKWLPTIAWRRTRRLFSTL